MATNSSVIPDLTTPRGQPQIPGEQKNALKPWQKEAWCIPSVSAELVWHMEDVLDLYAEPYDPPYPVVCFDAKPYQVVSEVRQPVPVRPGQPVRYDYEYRREGTCNLCMCFEPLQGWRHVKVTARRTAQDLAPCMQDLGGPSMAPSATVISVVVDNLNTPTPAALYATFPPAEACRILRKLDFHDTPKHGSWLNMAEIEFAVGVDPRPGPPAGGPGDGPPRGRRLGDPAQCREGHR